jgi:outer membrane protein assembly factor BamA
VRWIGFVAASVLAAGWVIFRHSPSAADVTADHAARVQEVRSIALEGQKLPKARLRAVLATHAGDQLDTAHLAHDRDAMERELADIGYLAARVEPAIITFDARGAAYITFEIATGKLFHLRTVEVTGAARDAAVVTIASGDDAIRERIEHARVALAEGLARRGKPASVELSVHTDLAAAAVDVVLATRAAPPKGKG